MLDDPFWAYRTFNYLEGAAWVVIALALPFVLRPRAPRQKLAVLAASLGFVLFGVTDFLEAPVQGKLPPWLWVFKILCAAFLLSCRYFYAGWDRFPDRYFFFGLACLAASLGVIIFQAWIYGF